MYWHKKIHSLDRACEKCDIRLSRKWNFKRHLLEVHGIEFHEVDNEIENQAREETERQEKDFISVSAEKEPLSCSGCKQKFACLADLETHHIKLVHMMEEAMFSCRYCGKEYNRKDTLIRHERTVHCD